MAKANERFRLVWSSSRSDWMIAPETAKAIGAPATVSNAPVSAVVEGCLISGCHSLTSQAQKLVTQFAAHNKKSMLQSLASLRLSTAIAFMFAGVAPSVDAQALQDPTVRSGTVTIDLSNTNHAVITQQSNKAIIDWRQFSIPSGSTVQFVQPNASSMMLNRVTGTQASQIDGNLLANGQVWLLNPSGVMIGNGGSINTASFLASTLDINNNDFLNGRYRFDATSNTTGRVVNAGAIKAAENGYVVLSGKQINNEGVIEAKLGSVLLGSGQAMTLDLVGDKLLSFAINTPVATLPADGKANIENSGRITAQGGKVMMTARTATDVMHSVINVSGVVDATSAKLVNGEIVLDGGSTGLVTVSGSLLAHGLQAGETGGAIKVFGKDINLANNAVLDVRGDTGGGVIHVGGGWQGSGLAGRTAALTTQVGSNAVLDASAINKGNGGEIAIWSDIHNKQSITNVSGTLLAKAGATSGNGGRIETSGYLLGTNGVRVNASAPKGLSGEWLLDPFNVDIVSSGVVQIIPAAGFIAASNTSISFELISNTLRNGTPVTIHTDGDININNVQIKISDSVPFFKLSAGNDINILNSSLELNGVIDIFSVNDIAITNSTIKSVATPSSAISQNFSSVINIRVTSGGIDVNNSRIVYKGAIDGVAGLSGSSVSSYGFPTINISFATSPGLEVLNQSQIFSVNDIFINSNSFSYAPQLSSPSFIDSTSKIDAFHTFLSTPPPPPTSYLPSLASLNSPVNVVAGGNNNSIQSTNSQPQPAPQQPAQQNQQPQPQAKQAAPDGDAPAPNQAPSNQQPAANKPPPKDGAAADAPDGETAAQPKQAANDPAAPAPAAAPAPRQTESNAPAAVPTPAPAPAPQSAPASNAAPAPVAPAAPTQVSLPAPPPPVAPPPPTPVATEKPPTPKDAADSGDKTLAMAAPPPPPKAVTQSQATTVRTSVVSPGLVEVQVPVPPRPPSGAAAEQPVPTMGNSARW